MSCYFRICKGKTHIWKSLIETEIERINVSGRCTFSVKHITMYCNGSNVYVPFKTCRLKYSSPVWEYWEVRSWGVTWIHIWNPFYRVSSLHRDHISPLALSTIKGTEKQQSTTEKSFIPTQMCGHAGHGSSALWKSLSL